ncbi:MAG: hypothetical protein ACK5KO_08790 [Arachnia sp.]
MVSLLPLETLPGWPEATDPSLGFLLILCLFAPLAVGVVVAVIGFAPTLARRAEVSTSTEVATVDESS